MAFFSYFTATFSSWKKLIVVLFLMTLLVNPSVSTSRGETTLPLKRNKGSMGESASKTPELFLGMLPKGSPAPPSGPSKQHN